MGAVCATGESEVQLQLASAHFLDNANASKARGIGAQRRYRCVAAFHWRWLYGQGPARSATRFIRAAKNPINSILIQADLETFYDYNSEYTEYGIERYTEFVPCPYISMLYRSATCVGVDDGVYGLCSTLRADMESGGDKNDGITVFDVTEPQNPRYCMVSVFGLEASEDEYHESTCHRPMSAKTYVEACFPYLNPASHESIDLSRDTKEFLGKMRTAYQGLDGVTLIDSATLAEAFPGEYDPQSTEWTKEPKEDDSSTWNDKEASNAPPDPTPRLPSLFSIAARKILQTVITEPDDDNSSMELLLRSPMDAPTINILRIELLKHSGVKLPDCVLPLLAKVLIDGSGARGFVDVTPFTLSPSQLTLIAPMISSCETLKLGGHNTLHIDAVKTMITTLPSLKTLVLFDKGIFIDEVESLYLVGHPRLQIGHKLSYFANNRTTPGQIGSRSAELEFVCMLSVEWKPYSSQEMAACVKMEDPNFVIRALCDMMSLLSSNGCYDIMIGLSQVCFGVGDRQYGAAFASSSLVDLAPQPRFPTTATRWIFVLNPTRFKYSTDPWYYGFIRYNAGEVVEILDLEGFVNALRIERPDLPAVVGFEAAAGDESNSFYQKLGSIIGTSLPRSSESAPSVVQNTSSKISYKLISPEMVYKTIERFTGKVEK